MPHKSTWTRGPSNIHQSFAVLFLTSYHTTKPPSKPSVTAASLFISDSPLYSPYHFFICSAIMLLSSMPDFTRKGCLKYMHHLLYFPAILQNPETKPDSDKPAQVPRQALHAEPGIFSAPHSHLSVTAPDKTRKYKYLRQQSPSSHSCILQLQCNEVQVLGVASMTAASL